MRADAGNALKKAVDDLGISCITYVPGYPITDIASKLRAEICVNEKVAMEMALGASACGRRSMVVVKNVGMNLLADPLVIAATHTIGSGLIVLAGDDLGPRGSQVEIDCRYYGPISELPVLEPRDLKTLYVTLYDGIALSETIRAPVILRVTSDLLYLSEEHDLKSGENATYNFIEESKSKSKKSQPTAPNQMFDRAVWDLTGKGRHQRYRGEVVPILQQYSNDCSMNVNIKRGRIGIVASGHPAREALDLAGNLDLSIFVPGCVHPLPYESLNEFLSVHDRILVLEDLEPFIEDQIRAKGNVYGRRSGHIGPGALNHSDLKHVLKAFMDGEIFEPRLIVPETVKERGVRPICDDCPFQNIFSAVGSLDVQKAGDAGCSILTNRPPWNAVDMVYGLGSSIGVAAGFDKKGVALIGDYALAHSGLQGLVNAIWKDKDVLIVVLDNGIAAMTGGQEAPDLLPVLRTLVPKLRVVDMPSSREELESMMKEELSRFGVSVVYARGRCTKLG